MEDAKQTRKNLFTWIFVGIVFIAITVILVARFILAGTEAAVERSNDRFLNYSSSWAEAIGFEATSEYNSGCVFAELISQEGYVPGGEASLKYANTLIGSTRVSHILFCKDGTLVCDEKGNNALNIDLSIFNVEERPTFSVITEGAYVDPMLTACVDLENGGYILLMESLNEIAKLFSTSAYEDFSFLSIMNGEGRVLGTFTRFKDMDSPFLTSENLLTAISGGAKDDKTFEAFKAGFTGRTSAAIQTEYINDSRTIVVSDTTIEDWYLVFGVRQTLVDILVENNFELVKTTVIKLAVVIGVFAAFVLVTVIFNSFRTKERGRALEDKADTDLLTELNNKAATERKIQEYLEANPNGRGMMFILDIDNFKKINDTMGHAFGDTLLKTLGKDIKTEFRMSDIIGRTGGDEFMIFLKDVTDDLIVEREANRITRFFHDFKAGGDYVKYSATASIGAAIYPDDAKTFKDLYIAADQALYRAKKRGKNQLVFYNESAHK